MCALHILTYFPLPVGSRSRKLWREGCGQMWVGAPRSTPPPQAPSRFHIEVREPHLAAECE
eukprot:scaffold183730_cov31-Tisochrysis_lutea.AAC.1